MFKNKKSLVISVAVVTCILFAQMVSAAPAVKVLFNGAEINYDVQPQIISERTMVPLRLTIETITGETMDWDEAAKTVTFSAGGHTNKHTIGETTVYVDGEAVEFPTPSVIVDSRTLVPVRMIAETSGCAVDWDGDNYQVTIESASAAEEEAEQEAPALQFEMSYDAYNVTGAAKEDAPDEPNYIGGFMAPTITGLGDETFETYVNKTMADSITKAAEEFEKEYNDFVADIAQQTDEELKEALAKTADLYNYISCVHLLTSSDSYFAVAEARSTYTGGAHGMQFVQVFNIDASAKKLLKLSDIFNGSGYKAVIEEKLTALAKTAPYKDLVTPDTKEVKVANENNFYLTDGKLVIFYQPYEIGPYAAGFIAFEIPFLDIEDILKEEYLKADFKAEIGFDKLFEDHLLDS